MSALSEITVLELAETVAGEYCGKLLADFGARVIKVERPGLGSPTRRLAPHAADGAGHGGLFAYLNAGKRSVVLDLEQAGGRARLAGLADLADVVIDDHATGWLARVGIDPDEVRASWPAMVLCAITPYGQNPPPERAHAEDLIVFHSSGWGYHTPGVGFESRPPLKGPGRFLVSYEAGQEAAMAIAACLLGRDAGQGGRFIDL
ncbi:MAG TPA: CoA transferase, partial [Novosphingobium sp.]|nr:CoA transferase [Novosphingobium sp.]